jgi:DNA-binding HxlR family transcriptional regulator
MNMKRTRLEASTCPVARSLDVIGWWSLLIVRDALRGMTRFGEFQKSLGIAKNMLTTRLKLLVDEDILQLQPASDGSAWQNMC